MTAAEIKVLAERIMTPFEFAQLRLLAFGSLKDWGSVGDDGKWKTWDWDQRCNKADTLVRWATSDPIRCSFCGKDQHMVKRIVAGLTAFACDECITLMDEIVKGKEPVAAKAPEEPN